MSYQFPILAISKPNDTLNKQLRYSLVVQGTNICVVL